MRVRLSYHVSSLSENVPQMEQITVITELQALTLSRLVLVDSQLIRHYIEEFVSNTSLKDRQALLRDT